jgi:hypothetical protein
MTEKTSTRIRLRVDRYVGEDEQAHLISVFGNDSDVGAITAAVHEKATFTLTFPDGEVKEVSLGEHASCYKGVVMLPDRKHPVRHLVAVSEKLYTMTTSPKLKQSSSATANTPNVFSVSNDFPNAAMSFCNCLTEFGCLHSR